MPGSSHSHSRGMWLTARAPVTEAVQGRGPLKLITWEDTEALNAVGSWKAMVPAANLRNRDVLMRGTVECWAIVAGRPQIVAKGIPMERKVHVRGDETLVELSGPSLGEELNYLLVHDLELTDPQILHPEEAVHLYESTHPGVWFDVRLDEALDDDPNNYVFINNMDAAGYLYFGHGEKFFSVEFTFDPSDWNQTPGITWRGQLFNGGGWVEIDIEDSTVDPEGRTFHQNGAFSWDEGHNWAQTRSFDHSLYWVRVWPSGTMDDFKIREIKVWSKGPKTEDIAAVLEMAPAGWGVGADGEPHTERGSFLQFTGETVLGALNKIAEQSGEFFRLTKKRQVVWLGNSAHDTGLTLVRARGSAPNNNPNVVFISDIEQIEDGWEIVTRLYPYGAGNGPSRLTMELVDAFYQPQLGWYYNFEENYLENGNATNDYGLIEREITFNEIQVIRLDDLGLASAANQLFWTASAWLTAHSAPVTSYRVTVVDGNRVFAPGDYVRLNFFDFDASGNLTFNAGQVAGSSGGYWTVTEVTQSFDSDGLRTSKLVLTNNVLRRVMYSGRTIEHRLEQALRMQTVRQPFPKDNAAPPVRTNVKPVVTGGKASAWEESIMLALANHLQIVIDATE